jgi:hypothetical protein
MSFEHPTAPVNTCRRNPDPFDLLSWEERNKTLAPKDKPITVTELWKTFFQWKTLKEDVIHFTPFDRLPKEQQDAIRARRLRAFKDSHVPWIITDFTTLAQALDDIDDMGKTAQFAKEYALHPTRIPRGREDVTRALDPDGELLTMRQLCSGKAIPRERKIAFANVLKATGLASMLPPAIAALFPRWRFFALLLQALQTMDGFFGVGIQLGPIIGLAEETIYRGLDKLGAAFSPGDNKYNQILAAQITRRSAYLTAAHRALHPEDKLSMLSAQYAASTRDFMPYVVIAPEDYPNTFEMFHHPWDQLRNFGNLFASLPYNLEATIVNAAVRPMFNNWSTAVNGEPPPEDTRHVPNSLERRIMATLEGGFCPGTHCNASIYQHFGIENQIAQRLDPISAQLIDAFHFFRSLLWHTPAAPPTSVTPSPRGIF